MSALPAPVGGALDRAFAAVRAFFGVIGEAFGLSRKRARWRHYHARPASWRGRAQR